VPRKEVDLIGEIISGNQNNTITLLSNTVMTYPKEWIVIHEVIQNAKDAIQKSTKERGKIEVEFDLRDQSVTISDNGTGFPYDLSLLGMGGTDKTNEDWRIAGRMGVGLKAVLFSTNSFYLESVHDGSKWSMKINDACRYEQRGEGRLLINEPEPVSEESHTNVSYSFPSRIVSEFLEMIWNSFGKKVSDDLAIAPIDKLKFAVEWYLRTYSYAGDVNRLLALPDVKPIDISITFRFRGELTEVVIGDLQDVLTGIEALNVEFENKHWDMEESSNRVRGGVPHVHTFTTEIPDGGRIGNYNLNYVWVRKLTTQADYVTLIRNQVLRDQISPDRYEWLFGKIRGIYIVIGSVPQLAKLNIEAPRRMVVANGIVSSHDIRTPARGGEYTLNLCIHFLVNVDAKLNYGKQNIPNIALLGDVYSFYEDAYRATLKNIAKSIVGTQIEGSSTGSEISEEPSQERGVMDRLNMPLQDLSIRKIPTNEDTLVALFYELVGKGYLQGYRTYSLFRTSRYDGKMILRLEGVEEWRNPATDSELDIIEFKLKTSFLIADFEEGNKLPQDIRLIVVWENDFENNPDYQVVDIENTDDADRRLPKVKRCLQNRRTGRLIQMLVLKEVTDELVLAEQGPSSA
jgi:hypothetical protein